jgi:hypothetical protein
MGKREASLRSFGNPVRAVIESVGIGWLGQRRAGSLLGDHTKRPRGVTSSLMCATGLAAGRSRLRGPNRCYLRCGHEDSNSYL